MIDTGLTGKTALITGANNPYGIGAAIAKALSVQGAKVFLQYYRMSFPPVSQKNYEVEKSGEEFYHSQLAKNCDEVLNSITGKGGEAYAIEKDLSDPKNIPVILNEAEKVYGKVDILINNAAYWMADTFIPQKDKPVNELVELWTGRPDTISAESFDRLFAVNTKAPALLIKEFVTRYVNKDLKSGSIINISTDGSYCFPSEISYGAGKFAWSLIQEAQLPNWVNTVLL